MRIKQQQLVIKFMNSDNSEEIKARKNKMNRSNRDIYIAGLEYLELANKMNGMLEIKKVGKKDERN